jgi:hypothetical protein
MSKVTNRDAPTRDGGSVEHRLARLLEAPLLARIVPHLPPEALHQLIRSRGLDACSELLTSATPAQLTTLLDLDLWRSVRPGRDQTLDVDRFGEWLEVLVDTSPSAAARTVAALDKHLVVAGLARYVRVCDPGIFEPTVPSDDEPSQRHEAMREGDAMHAVDATVHDSSSDSLECEVGGYIVRARRSDAWDAIVTLLVTLEVDYGSDFHAVMQGCRRFSNSRPEIDGLDNLLPAPEQHLHDVTIERERRRSQQGYATPADARAFLQLARQPTHMRSRASMTRSIEINPIVTAYFRAADEASDSSNETSDIRADATDAPESLGAVLELFAEAGLGAERSHARLEAADGGPRGARLTRLRRLMAYVRDTHETAYFTRGRELAFLANTLLAGCSVQSRPFTPQEASDAAAAICNLGLEYWPTSDDGLPRDSLLIDHDLITAFEAGWSVLHHDVSLFAADELISMLAGIDCFDRDIRLGLVALRRMLVKQRDAGTPWHAREAAEILAMLDTTAWIGVLGLLDECPVLPAALTAILEGRTTTVSPTAFDFIATAGQIDNIRSFMRKLPDVLAR